MKSRISGKTLATTLGIATVLFICHLLSRMHPDTNTNPPADNCADCGDAQPRFGELREFRRHTKDHERRNRRAIWHVPVPERHELRRVGAVPWGRLQAGANCSCNNNTGTKDDGDFHKG